MKPIKVMRTVNLFVFKIRTKTKAWIMRKIYIFRYVTWITDEFDPWDVFLVRIWYIRVANFSLRNRSYAVETFQTTFLLLYIHSYILKCRSDSAVIRKPLVRIQHRAPMIFQRCACVVQTVSLYKIRYSAKS